MREHKALDPWAAGAAFNLRVCAESDPLCPYWLSNTLDALRRRVLIGRLPSAERHELAEAFQAVREAAVHSGLFSNLAIEAFSAIELLLNLWTLPEDRPARLDPRRQLARDLCRILQNEAHNHCLADGINQRRWSYSARSGQALRVVEAEEQ